MSFSSKVKKEIAGHKGLLQEECSKRAHIREAFMSNGTMADPAKAYHLEFVVNQENIDVLEQNLAFFGLASKRHLRKSAHILYLKEAEQIATLLNIIGAHVALMEFENCRVNKDVNNDINRVANAQAANEDKIIKASTQHIVDIMDIQRGGGLSALTENLARVARLRLDNPLASLEDIGKMLTPPISKSGVNHRLKKIAEIAAKYREHQKTEVYND
ncbi:MAG: DNA-binding protein WhiA [Defluviitaleaceae bacterium]|nr:DNA-binding protein WhiA [Defluviitaleaceae bacterium]